MKRIAINGMGRIGRLTLRDLLKDNKVEVVAVNDLTDTKTIAHLFKYDTAHGIYPETVVATDDSIEIGNKSIAYSSIRNPEELPWKELNVDIVLECTGVFRTEELIKKHLTAGAKRVVLSAPAKGGDIPFVVLGVNDEVVKPGMEIISNASCTTNCLAPVVKLINDKWGITNGFVTTTHGYTSDQNLQDSPHSDLRRARAAAQNIIPTVGVVIPEMKGVLDASALRVPVITGSLIEMTCVVTKSVTAEEINAAFKEASENQLKGILEYNDDQIVSSDIIGNPHSSIFDAPLTSVKGNLIKVTSWYDNEAGYSARMADLTVIMANML